VGVLHDVIEDSRYTPEDLLEMGFSQEILVALDHLTKRDGESYDDYVSRTLENSISRRVKQADLLDNMDIRRMAPELTANDWDRLQRYRRAWERLKPVSV
jgi:(p)ppGpp synthase/HD superfamily hydrolase